MTVMTFHTQPFAQRFASMGDQAEGIFELVHTAAFDRYGLNRPRSQMRNMPARIRYTPDYITSSGLVECKGVGRDGIVKLKHENLMSLLFWDATWQVTVFVWNSHKSEYTYIPVEDLNKIINDPTVNIVHDYFDKDTNNPKAYWGFPISAFPLGWVFFDPNQQELELAA